jgi:3(or 17)beta-hydroxysteroid dehydrogenase
VTGPLYGRSAVVTGAASGIGSATTRLLLAEGANVLATDIDSKKGERLIRELDTSFPNRIRFLRQDVTLEDAWIETLNEAISSFGRLDVLVNNAGVLPALVGLAETSLAEWRRVMSVNLDGVFLGVKHAFLRMKGGAIVNVSSVAGLVGMPLTGAYAPSKGGVLLLTKAAVRAGRRGNRVPCQRKVKVHNGVKPRYRRRVDSAVNSTLTDTSFLANAPPRF